MTAKMPTFTPADSALLLIDHQTGTINTCASGYPL